jgi:citrate synthase
LASSLAAFYPGPIDPLKEKEKIDLTIIRLLAKLPTMAAWAYKNSLGHPVNYPKNKYNYCENFLHMMFAMPVEDYEIDPDVMDALDKLLILHADHEQNCSASTVRLVGSSQVSLYSAISAGISSLWGPLHGGANQEVLEMLEEIQNDGGGADKFLEKAKIIKEACDKVLNKLGVNDPILEIAKRLEEKALADDYFKERKLYPNVDFYSGIIYRAIGIPVDMFTVMFALGRLPGWIAQWLEMRQEKQPIGRPRQIYTGYTSRDYVDINKRG